MCRRPPIACRSRAWRRRRRRSARENAIAKGLAAFGHIVARSDLDDAREYPAAEAERARIERHASLRGKDVLEVGCGNGRLTLAYGARARSVVAIEPNGALVAHARRRARRSGLERVRFVARPAQTGIRGGPYDVVLFSWSLC